MASHLARIPLSEAAELLRARRISSEEITRDCLDFIQRFDSRLNTFISINHEQAIVDSQLADREIAAGDYKGPLHGIPIALKDLIDRKSVRTTAASRVLADNVAAENADVVDRLTEAGAIFLGKLNLHEFAYGGSGVISAYGPARNPRNTARITGGSSSGSAAAVAANFCYMAIGTDTAGSIRLPASFCGVVGFKPTYGSVSTKGVFPLSESLDHVGPLTRTVADARVALSIIANLAEDAAPEKPRIGIARKYFIDGAQSDVVDAFEDAVEKLRSGLEGDFREVELPVDDDRTLQKGESYQVHKKFLAEKSKLYDPRTLERIEAGAGIDEDQIRALRGRLSEYRNTSLSVFDDLDFVITLTCAIEPPHVEELVKSADLRTTELLMLRNTRVFNVLGWPTVTIPCGSSASGLPVGMQISAAFRRDMRLLQFAERCEKIFAFPPNTQEY